MNFLYKPSKFKPISLLIGFLFLACSPFSRADIIIPVIVVAVPAMFFILIPVIIIEAIPLKKFTNLSFLKSLYVSLLANIGSTLIGLPLGWLPFAPFLKGPGWLAKHQSPFEPLFMLIPFLIASYFVELFIAKRIAKDTDLSGLKTALLTANLGSYTMIFVALFMHAINL